MCVVCCVLVVVNVGVFCVVRCTLLVVCYLGLLFIVWFVVGWVLFVV